MKPDDEGISDAEREVVERVKDALLEHFDTVRIFVTKHDPTEDTTHAYSRGGGNFFAQQGQVHSWLERVLLENSGAEEEEEEQ